VNITANVTLGSQLSFVEHASARQLRVARRIDFPIPRAVYLPNSYGTAAA